MHAAVVHRQLSVICDRLIKIRSASYRIARKAALSLYTPTHYAHKIAVSILNEFSFVTEFNLFQVRKQTI